MNTNVIIILIGCATLVAIVAIVCDFIVERKMTGSSEFALSKKIIKIHRNYVAGILGFAVIMLLTANYGGPNNGIYQYLSFGSTITSLVLSILAIFVTVRSSSDLYKQFGSINKVSNQIHSTLNSLMDAEKELKGTSSTISSQVDNIVSEIEKRLDERLQKTESTISEQIQRQNLDTRSDESAKESASEIDPTPFLYNMSYSGLWALYACSKAYEMKQKFILDELFKSNNSYCLGVIITTKAIGFISGRTLLVKKESDKKESQIECSNSLFSSEKVYSVIKDAPFSSEEEKEKEKKRIDEYIKNKQ